MKPCLHLLSGNKHFFNKYCHRQTYQNYEQSRQKLGTLSENKVFKKSKFSKKLKVGLLVHYSLQEKKLERFDWFDRFSTLKNDFENQNFEMFEEVVHNFGKSDGDII